VRRSTESVVVRYIARRSVPFVQLYALYVLGHGEDGPGGGFQGGVIFAASFVLLGLANGWTYGRRAAPARWLDPLLPLGCAIYAGIGLLCWVAGGAFLEYGALALSDDPAARQHWHHYGLIGIEAGVMITVSAAMATLFFEMSRPARVQRRVDALGAEEDEEGIVDA
jgi:multicomponent Na+:H+ antiporter subunit B